MITIVVSNSICKVQNVSGEVDKMLTEELRYVNQNASFSFNKSQREVERIRHLLQDSRYVGSYQELNKRLYILQKQLRGLSHQLYTHLYIKGEFPTGLLTKVLNLLNYHKLQFTLCDLRKEPKRNNIRYVLKESFPPMRYYQKTSARLVTEKGRGIIVAPTGTGKTLTVARMIWELGVKTLVITPSKAITDNMVDALTKHFGKGNVVKLNTKSVKTKAINICNIQALVKIKPSVLADIDATFIDEFHHAAAETYQEINKKHLANCYFRIGVTATNFRNDGSDLALEAVLSEVIYEYTIKQAIADGFLIKPEFSIQETNMEEDDGSYQSVYKTSIVENEDRNSLIAEIADYHKTDSVLILVQQVEHGETLKKLIKDSEFLHGTEKDSVRQNVMEDFRKGKVKCLIGTTVLGEGVDLPIANILIMAGGGKARSQVMQNIGRVLRPYPGKEKAMVYDFADEGSEFLHRHALARQEIYEDYK